MRRVILAIVGTAAGLALLLSFKTHGPSGLVASSTVTSPRPDGDGTSATPAAGTSSGTVAGNVTQTIYGPIQVTITVKSGKVTAVSVPEYPRGTARDEQINSFAVPELIQETIAASSASIDSVSGATYTSRGYISSLQSAIDKAGILAV